MAQKRTFPVVLAVTAALASVVVGCSPVEARRSSTASEASVAALAAPLPLPSTELSSPAVASSGSGRTDLFTRASNGRLSYQYRLSGGSWTRPLDLGGTIASQPAAVSWTPGRLDVFARGTNNALHHRAYSGGRWSAWEDLGGVLTSAPAVESWAPGRLDVVVRGGDNALYHRYFQSGGRWSPWRRLGGILTSSPTITAWSARRLDVFARGGGNAIYHRWFDGTAWRGWERLSGATTSTSQPAAASVGVRRLDVVIRGTNSAMWSRSFGPGGWTGWASRGGGFASGPSAVATGSALRVVGRSPNGFVYEAVRATPGGAWSAWARIAHDHVFRQLGTWVDVFDYATLDPATAVPAMRTRGVRVLFLSTGRFNGPSDFFDATEAGQWLDLAHQNGIQVVGWYVPAYGDMARDVRRTVAIGNFVSPGGQRFDAIGVDIERLDEVTLAEFNQLSVTHLGQVRAQTNLPIAAIVPSPFTTDPGNNWAGFPWAAIGARSDVVVPMALWSFRANPDGSAFTPDQVYAWVLDQVRRARSLSGRPVAVEGGVDDPPTERTPVTAARVDRFVDAAIDGGAVGGSHYDYFTTPAALWPILARLNAL
jgi:hypothetical protein